MIIRIPIVMSVEWTQYKIDDMQVAVGPPCVSHIGAPRWGVWSVPVVMTGDDRRAMTSAFYGLVDTDLAMIRTHDDGNYTRVPSHVKWLVRANCLVSTASANCLVSVSSARSVAARALQHEMTKLLAANFGYGRLTCGVHRDCHLDLALGHACLQDRLPYIFDTLPELHPR